MEEKARWGRTDLWISLVVAVFVAAVLAWGVNTFVLERAYGGPSVPDGEVGGYASADTPRAGSLSDMEQSGTFTVELLGISYQMGSSAVVDGHTWRLLELPSGETVAAAVNEEAVQKKSLDIYNVATILPAGRLVEAPLDGAVLEALGGPEALGVTDRYVDMLGSAGEIRGDNPQMLLLGGVTLCAFAAAFFITHLVGVRRGSFPRLFRAKGRSAG